MESAACARHIWPRKLEPHTRHVHRTRSRLQYGHEGRKRKLKSVSIVSLSLYLYICVCFVIIQLWCNLLCKALLYAYQNGNGSLCRSLIKYGAAIGTYNDEGTSIFNHPVATKQLMFKLLDMLNKESPWVEADTCLECRSKFSITNRKHHW